MLKINKKNFLTFFEKTIDKSKKVCYSIYAVDERKPTKIKRRLKDEKVKV